MFAGAQQQQGIDGQDQGLQGRQQQQKHQQKRVNRLAETTNITDINTSFMDASNSSYVSIRDAINSRDTFNSRDHKKSLISSSFLMLTVRKPKSDSCIRPLFFFFILSPTPIAIGIYSMTSIYDPYDFYRKVPNSTKSRMGQVQVAVEVLHIAPRHFILPPAVPLKMFQDDLCLGSLSLYFSSFTPAV
jgi:hypothetical protein